MTGTIRTLRVDKGFGFIKDNSGKEYFFHQSAIYGEGIGGKPHVRNFDFGKDVTEIVIPSKKKNDDAGFPCPVKPEDWPKFWKPGEWNELRARIVGNPPKITTWIKGVKFMEYQDTEKRLSDKGGIALQVHGGGDFTRQFVRYRNIRVKELKK